MTRAHLRAQRELGYVLAWIALGVTVSGCVAKPAFHCQSDDACVTTDGSRGTCEASGQCSFHSALDSVGGARGVSGAGGASASIAGTASGGDGSSSSGDGGSAGAAETAGAGGVSCTDEAAGNCYACTPQTSAQFLNACTSSACVPFDDHARLTKLTPSGELPPLPPTSG